MFDCDKTRKPTDISLFTYKSVINRQYPVLKAIGPIQKTKFS